MSEYWVSKKKYWCQYCEIFIADDVPSRQQHENGLRHKGNKDRYIRGLYKTGIKKKQDSEEEKREMKKIEEAAQAAYARDIGDGRGSSSSSVAAVPTPKPKPPPPKPSDPYTNYTTAASLGITDPEVDRLTAEAHIRQSEGRAGEWVAVVPPPPPLPQLGDASEATSVRDVELEEQGRTGEVRKRVEEPVDEDNTHRFKLRKRTVAVGLGEIYDPGVIRVTPRADRLLKSELISSQKPASEAMSVPRPVLGGDVILDNTSSQTTDDLPKPTEMPKWTRQQWKWAGEDGEDLCSVPDGGAAGNEKPDMKTNNVQLDMEAVGQKQDMNTFDRKPDMEALDQKPAMDLISQKPVDVVAPPHQDETAAGANGDVKEEPSDLELASGNISSGSMFRKRKVPARTNNGRRHV